MKPIEVDDVSMAFGGIKGLMPDRSQIPEEFQFNHNDTWGKRLFNDWFYRGLTKLELTPKEGINEEMALRHIRTIMGSFEPKHEHKEEAVAYLLDLWFESSSAT